MKLTRRQIRRLISEALKDTGLIGFDDTGWELSIFNAAITARSMPAKGGQLRNAFSYMHNFTKRLVSNLNSDILNFINESEGTVFNQESSKVHEPGDNIDADQEKFYIPFPENPITANIDNANSFNEVIDICNRYTFNKDGDRQEFIIAAGLYWVGNEVKSNVTAAGAPGEDIIIFLSGGEKFIFESKKSKDAEPNRVYSGSPPALKTNKFFVFTTSSRSYIIRSDLLFMWEQIGLLPSTHVMKLKEKDIDNITTSDIKDMFNRINKLKPIFSGGDTKELFLKMDVSN